MSLFINWRSIVVFRLSMASPTTAGLEGMIRDSLITLVQTHIPLAKPSDIDEIVLSYVVGILDALASEADAQVRNNRRPSSQTFLNGVATEQTSGPLL